jgi:uncharacterized paraquat-inducible protein A
MMLIPVIVAAGLAGLTGLGLAVYFGRAGTASEDRSPSACHAHCPRCDQRVRYGTARAGTQVRCPRCRRHWTLPVTSSRPAPTAA